jgi:SMODS and SLOG-associating 2TM effector domain
MLEKQANVVETQSGNYEQFCRRVGIWPMSSHPASNGSTNRPAKNKGTYEQVVHAQTKTRFEYYTTASLINTALFAQIIIAAVITAVSAAGGPRVALTVLGAVNTIVAGSLTWVKGQGLPDRLLSYADELRRVREHIEDIERQYEEQPDFRLNVEEEAKKIYTMYDNARKNAEKSYVGTFKNISADGLKGDWKKAKDRPQLPESDGGPPPAANPGETPSEANGAIAQPSAAHS